MMINEALKQEVLKVYPEAIKFDEIEDITGVICRVGGNMLTLCQDQGQYTAGTRCDKAISNNPTECLQQVKFPSGQGVIILHKKAK